MTCICKPLNCCTLCSTFSCDCDRDDPCFTNRSCEAHKPTSLDDYHKSVEIKGWLLSICTCGHHVEDHAGLDSYGKCVMPGCKCEGYEAK